MARAAELQRREDEAQAEAERKRRSDLDSQVEANRAQKALHSERNRIEAHASAASEEQYRTYLEREKAQVCYHDATIILPFNLPLVPS
jgi:hypothetical protein